jgi:hypothetical protein
MYVLSVEHKATVSPSGGSTLIGSLIVTRFVPNLVRFPASEADFQHTPSSRAGSDFQHTPFSRAGSEAHQISFDMIYPR